MPRDHEKSLGIQILQAQFMLFLRKPKIVAFLAVDRVCQRSETTTDNGCRFLFGQSIFPCEECRFLS